MQLQCYRKQGVSLQQYIKKLHVSAVTSLGLSFNATLNGKYQKYYASLAQLSSHWTHPSDRENSARHLSQSDLPFHLTRGQRGRQSHNVHCAVGISERGSLSERQEEHAHTWEMRTSWTSTQSHSFPPSLALMQERFWWRRIQGTYAQLVRTYIWRGHKHDRSSAGTERESYSQTTICSSTNMAK
jgi:hypothetical protein